MLSPGAVEPCQHHGDIGTSLHTAGAGNNQWDSVKKDMTIYTTEDLFKNGYEKTGHR